MYQKLVALIGIVSLSLFALAGCEKKGSKDEKKQEQEETAKNKQEKDQKEKADKEGSDSAEEGGTVAKQGPEIQESMKEAAAEFGGGSK